MTVIDPRTIMCAIPCYSGNVTAELAGMLFSAGRMLGAISMPTECSDVSLVRNLIAANFLASPYEWLVCIDSDTVPSSLRDIQLLLEPCDMKAEYWNPEVPQDHGAPSIFIDQARPPRPSRVVTALCRDANGHINDKVMAAADMLVTAEYVYKNDELKPCKFGLGFTRIHRSVFERLIGLTHDGGPTVEVRRDVFERIKQLMTNDDYPVDESPEQTFQRRDAIIKNLIDTSEDKAGQPRLWTALHQGRQFYDFYPHGAALSMMIPGAPWKGEDHGFFTLCQLAGIIPRVETRTRLLHMGRKAYPYLGPDHGGGQ